MARAPFKMKSSPAKATLADFFKGIGGKKTDMGKLRATQKRMSRGESEWQHKTRGLAKAGLEARKNAIGAKTTSGLDVKSKPSALSPTVGTDRINKELDLKKTKSGLYDPSKPKSRYVHYSGAKGDKYKYRKIQVQGDGGKFYTLTDKENPDDLNPRAFEFQRPGSDIWETSKTKAGTQAIKDAYWRGDETRKPPIQKKSPYKLGIGTGYTKKPKGSRRYKMNKNR